MARQAAFASIVSLLWASACASSVRPEWGGADAAIVDATPAHDVGRDRHCRRASECGTGEICAFTAAGCDAIGTCAVAYPCGRTLLPYCGCDGATFTETCAGPDRPYTAQGVCTPACPSPAVDGVGCRAEGQRCAGEMYGTGCGPMTAECTCTGGQWTCVRYVCDPSEPDVIVDDASDASGSNCGSVTCDPATQFCARWFGGPMVSERDECITYPDACAADHSCACLARQGNCGADGEGTCSLRDGLVETACYAP